MKFLFSVLLLILSISAPYTAKAFINRYAIRHFNSVNGLPQNSVRAIAKGPDGFIWLATFEGLARFDGKAIRTFGQRDMNLNTNIFTGFIPPFEDQSRCLYGLTDLYDYIKIEEGKPVKFVPKNLSRLKSLLKTQEGDLTLTYATGLSDQRIENMPPAYYLFWIEGTTGNFYLWKKDGTIDIYKEWNLSKSYKTNIKSPRNLFRLGKAFYHAGKDGHITSITDGFGEDSTVKKVTLITSSSRQNGPILTKPFEIFPNNLTGDAFLYQNRKLYALSQHTSGNIETTLILDDFDFEKNNVSSVFWDRTQKRLYLGTLNNGFYILDFHIFETVTIESNEREANIFYAHTAYTDSTVITPSLTVLGKTSNGDHIATKLPTSKGYSMLTRTMVKDRTGDLWLVKDSVLYRYNNTGKQLKRTWNAQGEISHLYEDIDGRIWLGTRFRGLQYVDPTEAGMPLRIFTKKLTKICYILNEGKDVLWVGTVNGLFKVYLDRKTFSVIPGTEKLWVKSILKSDNGEVWFTAMNYGVFLIRHDKLTRFPLDRNHYLSQPHCIVIDQKDFLWIPTNNGLFRMSRADLLNYKVHGDSTRLYYHLYTQKDGFRIDEFNGGCEPCAVRLKNGYISFPSIDGMVFFKPEQIPVDVPDSKIFIDRVESASGDVAIHNLEVELSDISDLKVYVVSPYRGNQQNQQLYYTVSAEGKDSLRQIWYPFENEQYFIHLNNLSSGNYLLKIRKNSGFGAYAQQITMLRIHIPHAWYETWVFKILVLLAAIATSFLYYKNRLKKITRLNRVLETRVTERTRDLQETVHVLKNSEAELHRQTRLQMHLIASISHDIRSPLRSIEFTSEKLPGMIDGGDHSFAKTVGTSINESSKRILMHLENILSYVRSQLSDGSVEYDTFPVKDLVDEVAHVFKQSIAIRKNRFDNQIQDTLHMQTSRQLVKIILHNLIDNANKFTYDGVIVVQADNHPSGVTVIVSDNGSGLPQHMLDWFNNQTTTNPDFPDEAPEINGIGLRIVKELAEILKIEIKATTNSGTQFLIHFLNKN